MNEYPQPGLHPDADTLSAFVEGVLPEQERLACLGHFAECTACREVVYLAQEPLLPEAVPVADKVAWRTHWLKPILGLSVAALAGVLALSIALYRPEKPLSNTPGAVVETSAPAVEAPHITTPRAAHKRPRDTPRSVSVQVPPGSEALLAVPQLARPPHGLDSLSPAPANGALPADAQSAIAGTITDPSGAAIAGAAVTARQESGAPGAHAVTDNSGQFLIAGLPPGRYELQVTRPGFQPATKKVEIQSGQLARADSSLSVGAVSQTVQVTASPAAIDTQTQSLITTKLSATASAPLIGRTVAKGPAIAASASVSLPSKLAPVATATKGKVMLAADSAGTLYRSDNAGKKWKAVKAVWQGKIVELAAEAAEFRLTADTGTAWLSRDGSHWYSASPLKR